MEAAISIVAKKGKLELLEFVYEARMNMEDAAPNSSSEGKLVGSVLGVGLMNIAAMRCHRNIVQRLDSHKSDGFTTETMEMAASNGHLKIVQWLHQHRDEGCTTNATDSAAWSGHLSVIQWLHENRSEGCTTKAMDNTAQTGH